MNLKINSIDVHRNTIRILNNLSLFLEEGECISIIGSNGVGKTTLLNTISGILHPSAGEITFCDLRIDGLESHKIAELGVMQVPEKGRVFPLMTVRENLEMGTYIKEARKRKTESFEMVYRLFPVLGQKRAQSASSLSGGEQRMLAIARTLVGCPKVLMLDEISSGLAPKIIDEIFEKLMGNRKTELSILVVEQDVKRALKFSDRGYVMVTGVIKAEGKSEDLLKDDFLKQAYLGL